MSEIGEHQRRLGLMWRKYLRLTRGGVSVLVALDVMQEEEPDTNLRAVILRMRGSLEEGRAMSEFMNDEIELFSRSAVELIRTAEKHGVWDEALHELAEGLLDGTFT